MHFEIRTTNQRMVSANAACALDIKSDVKMLAEITRNINETIETKETKPLEFLVDFLHGSKAKLEAAISIIRSVSYGMKISLDPDTGRHSVTVGNKAGVNRHYDTLCDMVRGGSTGLQGNTLHDAIKSQWTKTKADAKAKASKAKAEPEAKTPDQIMADAVAKLYTLKLSDEQIADVLRKALAEHVKAKMLNGNDVVRPAGKPIMNKPSHPVSMAKAA